MPEVAEKSSHYPQFDHVDVKKNLSVPEFGTNSDQSFAISVRLKNVLIFLSLSVL